MTQTDHELFDAAERNLVQIHAFFPRIDARVSAIFAITSGQIAIATLNISGDQFLRADVFVLLVLFLICAAGTIFNLYWCTYPDLAGGDKSLIYFREIATKNETDFVAEYEATDLKALRHEVLRQVWRNSVIVQKKYEFLKMATLCTGISVVPWTLLLASVSAKYGKISIGG